MATEKFGQGSTRNTIKLGVNPRVENHEFEAYVTIQ